jgi:hypothetical protein
VWSAGDLDEVMRLRMGALRLVALIAAVPRAAPSQSLLAGVVRDLRTNAPLSDVVVTIETLRLEARTNAGGGYALGDVPAGRHVVIVRRLGYDSATITLPFSGADTVERHFTLTSTGQPLPEVSVAAAPVVSAKLREFERRRQGGIGRFLTPLDMEKLEGQPLSDVVARFPGVIVMRASGRYGGGSMSGNAAFVASSRGAATIENVSPFFGRNCPVAIWLDGVPVYRGNDRTAASPAIARSGGTGVPASPGAPPFDINAIMTPQVAAIEFYAGPAQMPAELNATQGACGALVIWTR